MRVGGVLQSGSRVRAILIQLLHFAVCLGQVSQAKPRVIISIMR